jgi:hypothetical protein
MKIRLVCSVLGMLCGSSVHANDVTEPCPYWNSKGESYYYPNGDSNTKHYPMWTELSPDQVKICMQEYWKVRLDSINQGVAEKQKDLNNAQKHLGMWQ